MNTNSNAQSNQDTRNNATVTINNLLLENSFIEDAGGLLNAIVLASAQYVYKVIERHTSKDDIKWFEKEKQKKLHRLIIHKNAHLDEYFAELLFRAILPPHMKDIEVKEHTLISSSNDIFAKVSWPNAVVFGIGSEDAGGAKALQIFDEHNATEGTRIKASCSQLVVDEFLKRVPRSIQIILSEVNESDSNSGAHQYNLKNLTTLLHETLYLVGIDEYKKSDINKYLTENWKRAIIDACIVAMIYSYQNDVYREGELVGGIKEKIISSTKRSLEYFLAHTLLSKNSNFERIKADMRYKFSSFDTIDKAVWRSPSGQEIGKQILVLSKICYALEKSWGTNISNFVMMHIWQGLFHRQLLFEEVMSEIRNLPKNELVQTRFGSVIKIEIDNPNFKPEQRGNDKRKRTFQENNSLWLFGINLTIPDYYNTATVFKALLNNEYAQKGNNGFGIILLHDKTINAKIVNIGPTIPDWVWRKLSDAIVEKEPDRWFQLKRNDGGYADFILNRNKAHQDHLPSEEINIEFIQNIVKTLQK